MRLDGIGECHHFDELANVTLWVLDAFVTGYFFLVREIEGDTLDDIFAFVAALLAELPYLGGTHLGGNGDGQWNAFGLELVVKAFLE